MLSAPRLISPVPASARRYDQRRGPAASHGASLHPTTPIYPADMGGNAAWAPAGTIGGNRLAPLVNGSALAGSLAECSTDRPSPEMESMLRESAGNRDLDSLEMSDLRQNNVLRRDLQQLRFNQHFDGRGTPIFRRLGLTFAAKQFPAVRETFGSRATFHSDGDRLCTKTRCRAKAYRLSVEAVAKDRQLGQKRRIEFRERQDEKVEASDVVERQLDMLFFEVPAFREYLPDDVDVDDIIPRDANRVDETKARRNADAMNARFEDTYWKITQRTSWLLSWQDACLVQEVLVLWSKASTGSRVPFGIDRPTFCRLILDLRLVDHDKVPYFWAVALFDEVAVIMRSCTADSASAPFRCYANFWQVVSVLDILIRQHFDDTSKDVFLETLRSVARRSLPRHFMPELERVLGTSTVTESEAHTSSVGDIEKDLRTPATGQTAPSIDEVDSAAKSKLSTADIDQEMSNRDFLISAMLLEPEVLHLIMQHIAFFGNLHRSYADDTGHLSFSRMLQFCTDFWLIPSITSSAYVRSVYEMAVSVETKDRPSSSMSGKKPRQRCANASCQKATPQREEGHECDHEEAKGQSKRRKSTGSCALPAATLRCVMKVMAIPKLQGGLARRGSSAGQNVPSDQASSQAVASGTVAKLREPKVRSASIKHGGELQVPKARRSSSKRDTSKESVASSTDSAPPPKAPAPPPQRAVTVTFGVAAFAEVISKIAFSYLGFYGNTVQQNSTSYARVIWMIVYLTYVSDHYMQNQLDSANGERAELHRSLRNAVGVASVKEPALKLLRERKSVLQPPSGIGFAELESDEVDIAKDQSDAGLPADKMKKKSMITPVAIQRMLHFRRQVRKKTRAHLPEISAMLLEENSSDEDLHEESRTENFENRLTPAWGLTDADNARLDCGESHLGIDDATNIAKDPIAGLKLGQNIQCIQNGKCLLCGSCHDETAYGRAKCRGCSVVDTMRLDAHPFHALLFRDNHRREGHSYRRKADVVGHELVTIPCSISAPAKNPDDQRMLGLFSRQREKESSRLFRNAKAA
eukprot:TRINITY_DN16707_c0_g1_i2.p1 TRINITY_DN16707_c0_g1~~TRINITY_DN16707_c0_g1_i2.p1  ORF type:complete len:1037 (-),score=163.19 TRINITY_DN16707_c0_g1_i2:301-3411(-)